MLDRYRRKIVGYDISYDKNPETIQKIIDTSPKANQYYSDGYTGYFNLNYHGGSYKSFNNKSQTTILKVLIQILESIFLVYKENPNVFQDL